MRRTTSTGSSFPSTADGWLDECWFDERRLDERWSGEDRHHRVRPRLVRGRTRPHRPGRCRAGADPVEDCGRGSSQCAAGADAILVQYAEIIAEVMDGLPRAARHRTVRRGRRLGGHDGATERGTGVCNVPDYGTRVGLDHAIGPDTGGGAGQSHLDRGCVTAHSTWRRGASVLPDPRPRFRGGGAGPDGDGRQHARRPAWATRSLLVRHRCRNRVPRLSTSFPVVGLDEPLGAVSPGGIPAHPADGQQSRHDRRPRARRDAQRRNFLVNTSRGGSSTDRCAGRGRCSTGAILGAAIDVHETEPVPGRAIR